MSDADEAVAPSGEADQTVVAETTVHDEQGESTPDTSTIVAVTEFLVRALADDPDAVKVTPTLKGDSVRLEVEVASGDLGRVIGKRGKVASSVRAIVRAAGHKDGLKVDVDFD